MKKVYLMALAALVGTTMMAQVDVTFSVDMNGQTVSDNGVHVAGNFQAAAGYAGDWDPSTSEMIDNDSDGIYELTVTVPAGTYQYKFINNNSWDSGIENVPTINRQGDGSDNRVLAVNPSYTSGQVLPAVKFSGSAPEGMVALRMTVDMAYQTVSDLGVHVAGDFSDPVWTPGNGLMFLSTGTKYAYVAAVAPDAVYAYKFLNDDFWGENEENVPDECNVGGNRSVTVGSEDVTADTYCFSSCDPCAPQTEVTFMVDMSNEGGGSVDGVFMAGPFNVWNASATPMTDDDADGIYEFTMLMDQGTQQFKYINGSNWENFSGACLEADGNRFVEVGEDPLTVTFCFNQCTEECAVDPDAANITFSVNMVNEEVAAEGVWVMGGFTTPQWQAGAIELLDDDADGIYTATVEVSGSADVLYKYSNGDPTLVEEDGDFLAGGCGLGNGLGGFNRSHTRSGEAEVLPVVCYNSCLDCGVDGVAELELGSVNIFPNPTDGISHVSVENPNNYTLRMNIVDVTGKVVRDNIVINSTNVDINTDNLNAGLYFLNIVNERSESATYKLMVK